MRVVIDTNVIVSSFLSSGKPEQIVDRWLEGQLILCLSAEILEEYIEILKRKKLDNSSRFESLLKLFALQKNIVFTNTLPDIRVVKEDPDDDKFIACAVALDAKIIISGDKHLLKLKRYVNIEILSPLEFLDRLSNLNNLSQG